LPLPVCRRMAIDSVGAQQHDTRLLHMLLRTVPRSDDGFQPVAVARTKPDLYSVPHPSSLAYPQDGWNHSSAPFH
jgi:hypothetical protein